MNIVNGLFIPSNSQSHSRNNSIQNQAFNGQIVHLAAPNLTPSAPNSVPNSVPNPVISTTGLPVDSQSTVHSVPNAYVIPHADPNPHPKYNQHNLHNPSPPPHVKRETSGTTPAAPQTVTATAADLQHSSPKHILKTNDSHSNHNGFLQEQSDIVSTTTSNDSNSMVAIAKFHSLQSVTATNTMISHVSSISDPFMMNDVLIVILGIGEYDSGLDNLVGVRKDYNNIIHTFVKHWKYKVLYKTSDMNVVYSNDMHMIEKNRNYKLYWTCDDIELFVEQARQHVVKNKHNGMIFVISSHGDRDKVICDSNLEEYDLDEIFNAFSPQWKLLLQSYKETEDESNHLFQIPKIFCIDSCRGNYKAKLTKVSMQSKSNTYTKDEKKNEESKKESPNVNFTLAVGIVGDEKVAFKAI